jgi:hypothetical protein
MNKLLHHYGDLINLILQLRLVCVSGVWVLMA